MSDTTSRSGHVYADKKIFDWCGSCHAAHDEGLKKAFETPDDVEVPAIQLAASEGKFLELLTRMSGAKRAVEIGTLVGYSAIRIARGLAPDGHLWSIEFDVKHAALARENIAAAGFSDRVTVVEGAGAKILPTLEQHGPFDLVFADADKETYPVYGKWAIEHLRSGGLLIGDNAFLFGRLLDHDAEAVAMREFHEMVSKEMDSVCVPTPDGMVLGVKK